MSISNFKDRVNKDQDPTCYAQVDHIHDQDQITLLYHTHIEQTYYCCIGKSWDFFISFIDIRIDERSFLFNGNSSNAALLPRAAGCLSKRITAWLAKRLHHIMMISISKPFEEHEKTYVTKGVGLSASICSANIDKTRGA